jgi:hypothetical protein
MMNLLLCRILRLRPAVRDLFVSAVGGFVMMRGFSLVAKGEEGPEKGSPLSVVETPSERWAGMDVSL